MSEDLAHTHKADAAFEFITKIFLGHRQGAHLQILLDFKGPVTKVSHLYGYKTPKVNQVPQKQH